MSCPNAPLPELTGNVSALRLVNLEKNGLSGYRSAVGAQASSSSRYASAVAASPAPAQASRRSYRQASSNVQQQSFNVQQSQVEQQVIAAQQPLNFQEREQVTVGPYRGIHLNRQEEQQFNGPVPLSQYRINEDPNPEVIRKRLEKLRYQQEVAVKYLQPPSPPKPGDLIIKERQSQVPPAPPVVLRQEAEQPSTPTPQVLRERPPQAPCAIPEQVVEVDGEPVPPPARRVVLEKLTSLPPKPQNVIIEKWLPYRPQKRRVIFQRSCAAAPQNPRNLIIEWEAQDAVVEKVCKNLGVERADPEDYVRRYGNELRDNLEDPCGQAPAQSPLPPRTPVPPQPPCAQPQRQPTPQCPQRQPTPQCPQRQPTPQCPQRQPSPAPQRSCGGCGNGELPELTGDVQALRLVDLDRHGLGAYRRFVQ